MVLATNPIARESTSRLLTNNNTTALQPTLTNIIDSHLATDREKLIAQSRTPSSTKNPTYNDTPFYQSLLRDLITTRSSLTNPPDHPFPNNNNNNNNNHHQTLHPPGSSSSSSAPHKRSQIDTKASKGRKVRYTVIEKLQHFMAAEGFGRSSSSGMAASQEGGGVGTGLGLGLGLGCWSEEARREFFACLFGGRGLLREDEGDEELDGEGKQGLRLFAS